MKSPWVNITLLLLLVAQAVTGYLGMVEGRPSFRWILWLHGIGAYALILLFYWKSAVIWDALRRKRRWTGGRLGFLVLLGLLIMTAILGLAWTFYGPSYLGGFSLVSLHIYLAIPVMALTLWHSWRMRFIWRVRGALGRRLFLNTAAVALLAALAYPLSELAKASRRFTGSYERGSFSPHFPVVSWINDRPPQVDVSRWRLEIGGAVTYPISLSYAELRAMATTERIATLDCTGGWYATQSWRGVSLFNLLQQAQPSPNARSVTLISLTGYRRRFSLAEAAEFLLALDVAGEPLTAGHGFPLRLVPSQRRGVEWVKWLGRIEINTASHLLQPPLPLQ